MISAIVLAAGLSRRMGRPKLPLPWENTTVIGQVVSTLVDCGLDEIIVVTGGVHDQIESVLYEFPVKFVLNRRYRSTEMLYSLQLGILTLDQETGAALVTLGDQPQIEKVVVKDIIGLYRQFQPEIVVPSFNKRRGHPWLLDYRLYKDIMKLKKEETLRDFLDRHQNQIYYLPVKTPSVLEDIDTFEDYLRFQQN